jgi:hypothetical protein
MRACQRKRRCLSGQACTAPCEPQPLRLSAPSGLSRTQFLVATRAARLPLFPAYCEDHGGTVSACSLCACACGTVSVCARGVCVLGLRSRSACVQAAAAGSATRRTHTTYIHTCVCTCTHAPRTHTHTHTHKHTLTGGRPRAAAVWRQKVVGGAAGARQAAAGLEPAHHQQLGARARMGVHVVFGACVCMRMCICVWWLAGACCCLLQSHAAVQSGAVRSVRTPPTHPGGRARRGLL